MQKAIVAGGAGFLGSHLCKALLDKGYNVICIDNLITGEQKNISGFEQNPHFSFIQKDITDKTAFTQINDLKTNLKYIFHLASPASPNKKSKRSYINHPIETLLANSIGTQNLLDLSKESNAKFLYASSSEIYGDPSVSPQAEEYFGNVNPVGPRSVYDEGKRFGEAITMVYFRLYNADCRIIRIFNTYGPNMQKDDGRVVSNFISQALINTPLTVYGDGSQTRSFCYVDDMVSGIILSMLSENTKGQVINLGNPQEQTVLQLATIVKEITKSQSEISFEELMPDDPKKRKPDISKAQKLLEWTPAIDLQQGLAKTIDYFKSN